VLQARVERQLGRERFRAEGDDLLQNVRLAVLKNFRTFRGRDRPALVAWLRRVARTTTIDWERRRRARRRGSGRPGCSLSATNAPEVAAAGETPSQRFLKREELERVLRTLETLPGPYREVLQIVVTESPEPHELAARLGRGPDATRKLVARALEALRRALRAPP
jgi:RNA polymerase sigma factor (sigma-70 family)